MKGRWVRNIKKNKITEHTTMYAYKISRKMGEKGKWEYWKKGTIPGILYYGDKENMEGKKGNARKMNMTRKEGNMGRKGSVGRKRECGIWERLEYGKEWNVGIW